MDGTELSFEEQFLVLEAIGRSAGQKTRLLARYFDDALSAPPTDVTIGLPTAVYHLAYRTDEMLTAELVIPMGASARIREDAPGVFQVNGPEWGCKWLNDMIAKNKPPPAWTEYPLMYFIERPVSADLMLRVLYRAAEKCGAKVFVSTQELSGRLEHVMASWMLDTYEDPIDIYIKKDSQWAVYHTSTQCAFESSDWFFEAEELLDHMNKEGGNV